jgi:hypothetical protein
VGEILLSTKLVAALRLSDELISIRVTALDATFRADFAAKSLLAEAGSRASVRWLRGTRNLDLAVGVWVPACAAMTREG